MKQEYREEFFLSVNEGNAEKEMALPLLASKLIEIATAHANSLGIGNPDMKEINGGWVLSRLSIEMKEYPIVNRHYAIATWVESWNRHFSTRCFAIESSDGRVLGYARSIWMVMHVSEHTNLGLGHFSLPEELISKRECPIAKQATHKVLPEEARKARYRFKYCDMDYYRHVNTVRYIALLLNQFPLELHDSHLIDRMELSFLKEAKYGMEVEIASLLRHKEQETLEAELTLTDCENLDGKPLLFSRLRWRPRHIQSSSDL